MVTGMDLGIRTNRPKWTAPGGFFPHNPMNALSEIKSRFQQVLDGMVDDSSSLLEMIRPAQDSKFGDYQANCAMPLGKQLGKSPLDVATERSSNDLK